MRAPFPGEEGEEGLARDSSHRCYGGAGYGCPGAAALAGRIRWGDQLE